MKLIEQWVGWGRVVFVFMDNNRCLYVDYRSVNSIYNDTGTYHQLIENLKYSKYKRVH